MIRYGSRKDIPGLKQLWKESFGDEDAYIDSFFEMLYQDSSVLLEEKDGMLLGASFFLPGRIFTKQGWQTIRYVYALAVYPEYRGQKIASRLLDEAADRYKTPLITEPADQGLADRFYAPYGFKHCFFLDYTRISDTDHTAGGTLSGSGKMALAAQSLDNENISSRKVEWKISSIDAEEYFKLREKYFCKNGFVEWPLEHIKFALCEHRKQGGDAILVQGDGREGLVLYTAADGKVVVTETTFSSEEAATYLPGLLSMIGEVDASKARFLDTCGQIVVKSRNREASQCKQMIGMAYGIAPDDGYLNLTLD